VISWLVDDANTRSASPFRSKSPTATSTVAKVTGMLATPGKPPTPSPRPRVPEALEDDTAKSARPLLSRSGATIPCGPAFTAKRTGAPKPPAPLPRNTDTSFVEVLATTRSMSPLRSKSATARPLGDPPPVARVAGALNAPPPVAISTEMLFVRLALVTRSSFPSWVRSTATTSVGPCPVA
jgi:hypothetical protein